jgi:hypothetical protein
MTWNFSDAMTMAIEQRGKMGRGPKRPNLLYCLKTWVELKEKNETLFKACEKELLRK